ncbi:hypothetical protein ABH15_11505 [Methanoculleus taiwanensis]|uniref:Protein-S-isoprenylcysteine methyltransferase n=2 Tax=Methanoculleus taiwanensis TaxID=1550565 RepID=A0A498GX13_9EURY|nr:protein-S-isoprenylcysteine O-methyltransferase [Methanoculleus taiwanensis]RXE55369.1 hypothetical protein ABH15_11505 [Methanoculleus taiwanensis]
MEESIYQSVFLGLLILFLFVRAPYVYKSYTRETVVNMGSTVDRMLLLLTTIGMAALPLLYSLTPILAPFSVPMPDALRIAGGAVYLAALVLMLLILRELGGDWSMGVELKENHRLVTSGPYRFVRHPTYTAFTLMMAGQLFLTANWLVGIYGIAVWALFCVVRIPREEAMMLEEFGDEYRTYRDRTGILVPNISFFSQK